MLFVVIVILNSCYFYIEFFTLSHLFLFFYSVFIRFLCHEISPLQPFIDKYNIIVTFFFIKTSNCLFFIRFECNIKNFYSIFFPICRWKAVYKVPSLFLNSSFSLIYTRSDREPRVSPWFWSCNPKNYVNKLLISV